MMKPTSIFPDELSENVRAEIDAICDRYEAAWKEGTPPRLGAFLALDGLARQILHRELLTLDQEYRRTFVQASPPTLRILHGPHAGMSLVLGEGTFLVGRDPHADLALKENVYCSWRHLLIEVLSGSCTLRDLDTKNGTRLDGKRIANGVATPAVRGMVLEIGDTRMILE